MKISAAAILALCAAPASAFVVQGPKASASSLAALSEMQGGWQSNSRDGTSYSPAFADQMNSGVREVSSEEDRRRKGLSNRISAFEKANMRGPRDKMYDGQSNAVIVQGGSLKTWSFMSPAVERVQVVLKTEGRPLDADIELWQGPDNTPQKMRVYVEDGSYRPFSAVIETPRGPNTVAIRNIGQLEFPMDAYVVADVPGQSSDGPLDFSDASDMLSPPRTIQGGALRTYPFDPSVESVQVLLRTDGRPLKARIELLQGPNNNKQVMEVYTEDGLDRPFFCVIETPGSGNVVRVVNAATVEFPMTAWVEPYLVGDFNSYSAQPIIGGDNSRDGFVTQW